METLQDVACRCIANMEFGKDVVKQQFSLAIFKRVAAKEKTFTGNDFKYCVFEDCYFRKCKFVDCDFTGAQFRSTNLRGSSFEGCRFDYCRFNLSIVPLEVLERNMPGYENVALDLARSLRVNYTQVGDIEGVNKAISVELDATRVHLKKAAFSREGYYRKKHKGLDRLRSIISYFWFNFLHIVWGNGESLWRTGFSLVVAYLVLLVLVIRNGTVFSAAFLDAFSLFWGTYRAPASSTSSYPALLIASAVAARYILFGLFLAVLIRRFSKR